MSAEERGDAMTQDAGRVNFRIVDGRQVEVDVTLVIDAETVMHEWWRLQRDLLAVDGLRAVKVDDLPPALIRTFPSMSPHSRDSL